MPSSECDILIGIDAGTSVIKAVAFDLRGRQIASAEIPNRYVSGPNGAVTQSLNQTWSDCAQAIVDLGKKVANLAKRTAAVSVTGQGDGTWLVDKHNDAVGDAWLWLDGRASDTVIRLKASDTERQRFECTGTGLSSCQQGVQLAHMVAHHPELLARADAALHCKDWLFLKLTGVRATDPSEASFTFGDFRNRQYSDDVIDALGLRAHQHLLPEIVDGSHNTVALHAAAAKQTGLLAGTPVSLGYVDMVSTALGAGVCTADENVACSVVGSTGVHMRAVKCEDVYLNADGTGYVIALPIAGKVCQVQSNMAAALNIDWVLGLATDVLADFGYSPSRAELVNRIEPWMQSSRPGELIYHPYISAAGERGPFVNGAARASFVGFSSQHRFADVVRAVVESLGMAARDCYGAMGELPSEIRLSGGAARSGSLRSIFAASVGAKVRLSKRDEAGAAGAAMMSAVAIGAYDNMQQCVAEWVTPLLSEAEDPDAELVEVYGSLYPCYQQAREQLEPVWRELLQRNEKSSQKLDSTRN